MSRQRNTCSEYALHALQQILKLSFDVDRFVIFECVWLYLWLNFHRPFFRTSTLIMGLSSLCVYLYWNSCAITRKKLTEWRLIFQSHSVWTFENIHNRTQSRRKQSLFICFENTMHTRTMVTVEHMMPVNVNAPLCWHNRHTHHSPFNTTVTLKCFA